MKALFGNTRSNALRTGVNLGRSSLSALACMVLAGASMNASRASAQTAGSYQVTPILSDGYATAPVVESVAGMVFLNGCATTAAPITPAGTSQVKVTATSGSIVQTTTIALTVQ